MNALQYNNDQYTFTELGLQEKLQYRFSSDWANTFDNI